MFGLTKREQRWAADQKAAELLVGVVVAAIKADAEVETAKAKSRIAEIDALREKVSELRKLLADKENP